MRIELTTKAWKALVLPLNYTRVRNETAIGRAGVSAKEQINKKSEVRESNKG